MPRAGRTVTVVTGMPNRYVAGARGFEERPGRKEKQDFSGKDRLRFGTSFPDDTELNDRCREGTFSVCCTACEE